MKICWIDYQFVLPFLALCLNGSSHSRRTQSVKVNGILSMNVPLVCGVPQGLVMGPIPFTLYTKALNEVIQSFYGVSHHFYADDTQIYTSLSPNSAKSNLATLQNCVSAVQGWMTHNRLKLNLDKTELLVVGTPAKRDAKFSTSFSLWHPWLSSVSMRFG